MANMTLKDVKKVYPNGVHAVNDFNINIEDGEFIAFVGPSGCGKSTTLRMIAGLEEITEGDLIIDGKRVNDLAPKDRDIAMVFQSYALYPHMTVYHNMAFSLMIRKEDADSIHKKVMRTSEILGLEEYLTRKPKELSGGQRQRVALGRAIVRDPKVFLMDEPLSNLDAKLRGQMRTELIKLHKSMSATTIYVTHDQTEAMTMADRIVVMSMGHVQQIGTPKEVYNYPDNKFVAGFIGTPPMNFLEGVIKNDKVIAGNEQFKLTDIQQKKLKEQGYDDQKIIMGIRPEDFHLDGPVKMQYPESKVKVVVDVAELLGKEIVVNTFINEIKVLANFDSRFEVEMGEEIEMTVNMEKVHFFDYETELRIIVTK